MTKAFLEPTVLSKKSEKFIREAFSEENMKKIKTSDEQRETRVNKPHKNKLTVSQFLGFYK